MVAMCVQRNAPASKFPVGSIELDWHQKAKGMSYVNFIHSHLFHHRLS